MAKIQGPGLFSLKRIAVLGDVVEVQFGAASDGRNRHGQVSPLNAVTVTVNIFEQQRVLEQGHLDRLTEAGQPVVLSQGVQGALIVDNGPRHGEDTHVVLLVIGIDTVLHGHGRIRL